MTDHCMSPGAEFPSGASESFQMRLNFRNKKSPENQGFQRRGRGNRTPVNGFGDRRTTAVLFPYRSSSQLTKAIIAYLG